MTGFGHALASLIKSESCLVFQSDVDYTILVYDIHDCIIFTFFIIRICSQLCLQSYAIIKVWQTSTTQYTHTLMSHGVCTYYISLLQLLLWPEVAGVTTLLLAAVVCTRVQPSIAPVVRRGSKF